MSGFQSGRQAEPRRPRRAESTRRILSLELSADRDVQRVHGSSVNSLDIDATEGRYLLSGGADGAVAVYDLENPGHTREAVRTVGKAGRRHAHAFGVETVQWYPRDAGMFVSSSLDGTVKAWDAETLTPAEVFRFRGSVFCHHMSPVAAGRHSLVAVGTEGPEVRLCDLKSGSLAHALRGHGAEVLSVRWSPRHEHVLATAGADGGVRVWDVRRAAGSLFALHRHDGDKSKAAATAAAASAHGGRVNGLCFSGDGLFLLSTGTDNRMRLWNSATGEHAPVNYGEVSNGSRRRGLKFAVSGGRGGTECVFVPRGSSVAVYAMHTGQMAALLRGHYGNVDCCHFHPDHQELYSGGRDCNILAWVPLRHRPDAEDNPAFKDSWSSDED